MSPDRQQIEDALRLHVDRLAGLIGPRHLGKPDTMAAAAGYIEREFTTVGYSTARQSYLVRGHEVANIVAELPGGRRKDEIVILGAHYDTVFITPGADDNASAVAVMLEAPEPTPGRVENAPFGL